MFQVNRHKKFGIVLDEFIYVDDYRDCVSDADISTISYCKNYPPNVKYKVKKNIGVDLTKTEEMLLAGFSHGVRGDVNKEMRNHEFAITNFTNPTEEFLREFCEFYDAFAAQCGIDPISKNNIYPYLKEQVYTISCLRDKATDQIVSYYTYIRHDTRITTQFSCSNFRLNADAAGRNRVGRANKYLHYYNMVNFKNEGCTLYEFGGYHEDENGKPATGIDNFKKTFGGTTFTEYSFYYPRTLKGRLVLCTGVKKLEAL